MQGRNRGQSSCSICTDEVRGFSCASLGLTAVGKTTRAFVVGVARRLNLAFS